MITTNSSPPRRAAISPSRTERLSRWATSCSTASPALWPRVSFTCLKPSRSRHRISIFVVRRPKYCSSPRRLKSPVRRSRTAMDSIFDRSASSSDRLCVNCCNESARASTSAIPLSVGMATVPPKRSLSAACASSRSGSVTVKETRRLSRAKARAKAPPVSQTKRVRWPMLCKATEAG